jgi:hypothetical protein
MESETVNTTIYKAIGYGLMLIAMVLYSSQDAFTKGAGAGFFAGVLAGGFLIGQAAFQARKHRKSLSK